MIEMEKYFIDIIKRREKENLPRKRSQRKRGLSEREEDGLCKNNFFEIKVF